MLDLNSPSSRQNSQFESVRRSWFDKRFTILAGIILALAIASRFWDLANKPFHHDESLHAYYSHVIAAGGSRDYDPLLHGPFLYYFVGFFQYIASFFGAGLSDFAARAPAAFFGVLVVASPLLVRKLVGSMGTLVLMLFLLVSPTMLYFGRFLREDVFTSIWVLGTLFGAALTRVLPDTHNAELRFGNFLQVEFPFSPKTAAALFSTSMMAFHFTNKENSFLHFALWILAVFLILAFENILGVTTNFSKQDVFENSRPREKYRRVVFCVLAFSSIFVIFFSSFFRHSQGWWNGVLDGLYRKSLVYWWQQDQQRRIDGPFDYHLPIIANYEFLFVPLLMVAWARIIFLSRRVLVSVSPKKLFARSSVFYSFVSFVFVLLLATLFAPRLPLVAEGCSIADIACTSPGPLSCHGSHTSPFCFLHITHTRHLLQIILYSVLGGSAFLGGIYVRRRIDAFLWFWLTGAIGTYSYVGEKVPWLTVYIVLPMALIAGLETARVLGPGTLPIDLHALSSKQCGGDSHALKLVQKLERKIAHTLLPLMLLWVAVALPFAAYKGIRVAFWDAENPNERLVFTQTTQVIKDIRDRWVQARERGSLFRISIDGESTWPLAWYVLPFKNFDFVSTANGLSGLKEANLKKPLSAIFVNEQPTQALAEAFPEFNIYRVPLRAWWVPRPNPTFAEMLSYFLKRDIYPANHPTDDTETGKGATFVLYLERADASSPFLNMMPLKNAELIAQSVR